MAKQKYYTASFHNGGKKEDAKDTKGTKKSVKFQANREHNIRDEEYCKSQDHITFKNKTEAEHEEWAKTHIIIDENQRMLTRESLAKPSKNMMQNRKGPIEKSETEKNILKKLKIQKIKFLFMSLLSLSGIKIIFQKIPKKLEIFT